MILVAVPTFETIAPECFKAIYDLKGDDLSFDYVRGYDCAKARNDIAKKALEGNYSHVLMVDSDIIVPPLALDFMLEYPADVCFGVYPRGSNPDEAELFKRGTFSFTRRYTMDEIKNSDKPRIPVKGGGFGCALINSNVFRAIEYPWFNFVSYEDNTYLSEDLFFCMMAEEYKIEADTRVICKHIKKVVY